MYYEPKRRSAVEAALAKMNFDIVGFKEQAADAAEATDQHLGALPWRSRWWAFPGKPVG